MKDTALHHYPGLDHRGCKRSVAYLDESFEVDGKQTFYILGCAVVQDGFRGQTRKALSDFNDGQPLHAAPMYGEAQYESLAKAIQLVQGQQDGLDVVVCSPVSKNDPQGNDARLKCINHLIPELHASSDVDLFIFDRPSSQGIADRDTYAINDLRRGKKIGRDVQSGHFYPRQELLLALPDLLAWSYRQDYLQRAPHWFDPLREDTVIQELS